MNFLQDHYNQLRKSGMCASSKEYEIVNDLSKETMVELESGYQAVQDCKKCNGKGHKRGKNCSCWTRYLKKNGRWPEELL